MCGIHHGHRLGIVPTGAQAQRVVVYLRALDGHIVCVCQGYQAACSCPAEVLCVVAMTQDIDEGGVLYGDLCCRCDYKGQLAHIRDGVPQKVYPIVAASAHKHSATESRNRQCSHNLRSPQNVPALIVTQALTS